MYDYTLSVPNCKVALAFLGTSLFAMHLDIYIISRYIIETRILEKRKRLTIWNGGGIKEEE